MRDQRLLAVDLSNQVYRACHAHDALSFDGEFTGGLYGFLQSVSKAIDVSGATDLLVCKDMKPYRRSALYPQYKAIRKTAQDPDMRAMYDASLPQILDLLDVLDIPTWGITGFECDDLIATTVRRTRHRFESVCAMCSDSDLFQLFDVPGFRMYKNAKSKLVDPREFRSLFNNISTEEFILASAMAGTHNEVEGVKGVGMITAVKIIKDPVKLRSFRSTHAELIDRNLQLIRLPHPELPHQPIPLRRRKGDFDSRTLYRFCARYNIQVQPWVTRAFDQVL